MGVGRLELEEAPVWTEAAAAAAAAAAAPATGHKKRERGAISGRLCCGLCVGFCQVAARGAAAPSSSAPLVHFGAQVARLANNLVLNGSCERPEDSARTLPVPVRTHQFADIQEQTTRALR